MQVSDIEETEESIENESESEMQRKLFVGGLSWQTTEEVLKNYFESIGIGVEKVIIMRDKITGRSRGFGFVTLKKLDDIDKAVNTRLHLVRRIEAKRAIPKREMQNSSKKLFVGGIPISLTNVEFRKYFETFGTVADAQIMTERHTGHSRGFGFITFEDDEVARTVLKTRHVMQGKTVEVKKAQPKKVEPIHIVHPYPMPFFPPYPSMYAPIPIYASPALYQSPISYDPYMMSEVGGGIVYTPHIVDNNYSPLYQGRSNNNNANPSRKNSEVYSPSLLRPVQSRVSSSGRHGSSLYPRVNTTSPRRTSFSYLVSPQERTERAFSAGPPAFNYTSTASSSISTNSQNVRKRGMSHPPINRRSKSSVISVSTPHHVPIGATSPVHYMMPPTYSQVPLHYPTYSHVPLSNMQSNSRRGNIKEEDRLHRYFQ